MKVKVKYFGAIAEQAGTSEETLDLTTIGSEVIDIKAYCIQKYNLATDDYMQVAINQELNKEGKLRAGDEIAFLPPFAGG